MSTNLISEQLNLTHNPVLVLNDEMSLAEGLIS
jgi:hypothetical protein